MVDPLVSTELQVSTTETGCARDEKPRPSVSAPVIAWSTHSGTLGRASRRESPAETGTTAELHSLSAAEAASWVRTSSWTR